MGLFKPCRSCAQWAQQYKSLQLDLADTRELLLKREAAWEAERLRLLDRVLVVQNPSIGIPVLRAQTGPVAVPVRSKATIKTLNLPGFEPDLRPPVKKN